MAREKRTKPCSNCKRSKVKCSYTDNLPCERCIKIRQAHTCMFVPKLPSLKFGPTADPSVNHGPNSYNAGSGMVLPPFNAISSSSGSLTNLPPPILPPQTAGVLTHNSRPSTPHRDAAGALTGLSHYSSQPPSLPVPPMAPSVAPPLQKSPTPTVPSPNNPGDASWKSDIDSKMSLFDDRLNNLVDVFTKSQREMLQNQEKYHQEMLYHASLNHHAPLKRQLSNDASIDSESDPEPIAKRIKSPDDESLHHDLPPDFRNTILSLTEAKELFHFFDKHITPQLFGFEISKISIDNIWDNSPILICAICTISAMHHPQQQLADKSKVLSKFLHKHCGDLLFKGRPTTEIDGFNTILALIFCSFWLSESQMFTGLALQIAKEIGLDTPQPPKKRNNNDSSRLNSQDRLKLWYLLYILDGQQSLTYNRQPLVNGDEYSLQHSRSLLMNEQSTIKPKPDDQMVVKPKVTSSNDKDRKYANNQYSKFNDMRLVSQVEYNQALSEAFRGNAWDLLTPSSLGIPSKSNLELDKWMVSWTVLLSPMNHGAVWSSKSTLIYYNFAKMHINSMAVRQLQSENAQDGQFPKLKELHTNVLPQRPEPVKPFQNNNNDDEDDNWEDESDSDNEEQEFIPNKELISKDAMANDAMIAFNAAQTVLNLVLNDKDIVKNLKYVPVHIHIMLYYAALLLVGDTNKYEPIKDLEEFFKNLIVNLTTVSSLRKLINDNAPVDKNLGHKLLSSLDSLIEEKMIKLKSQIAESEIDPSVRNKLLARLDSIQDHPDSGKFELFDDEKGRNGSPPPIYAWPGSNHGHPSQG